MKVSSRAASAAVFVFAYHPRRRRALKYAVSWFSHHHDKMTEREERTAPVLSRYSRLESGRGHCRRHLDRKHRGESTAYKGLRRRWEDKSLSLTRCEAFGVSAERRRTTPNKSQRVIEPVVWLFLVFFPSDMTAPITRIISFEVVIFIDTL